MTKDEAMDLALEALDIVKIHFTQNRHVNDAITAIKQARSAPVQEPVALDVTLDGEEAKLLRDMLGDDRDELSPVRLLVGNGHSGHGLYAAHAEYQEEGAVLLAATPPAARRQWVGLTDEEMHECAGEFPWTPTGLKCVRAIEAKLKEKNT